MTHTPHIVDYSMWPDRLGRALLDEVRSLRRRTRRQSFAASVHVRAIDGSGAPIGAGSNDLLTAVRSPLDHALRVDLLVAAAAALVAGPVTKPLAGPVAEPLAGAGAAAVFVVRPGPVEVTDDDLGWLRAWRVAADIATVVAGPVWAIGRRGWVDVAANRATLPPRHRLRVREPARTAPASRSAGESASRKASASDGPASSSASRSTNGPACESDSESASRAANGSVSASNDSSNSGSASGSDSGPASRTDARPADGPASR